MPANLRQPAVCRFLSKQRLSCWHTYENLEVDAVIDDARVEIKIRSKDHVETERKKVLKKFVAE